MLTLGIDYGAQYIGIALVRNSPDGNEPLIAGTLLRSERALKDKVQPRAASRRLRRTRKTKKARLGKLRSRLLSLGVDEDVTCSIVKFCERRGYKRLKLNLDVDENKDKEELTYRFDREEFFQILEKEMLGLIPHDALRGHAFAACEQILNRYGDPSLEIRPMRIDNRGVSRCAWEGCKNVTPRRVNAMEEAIKQVLVTFFQAALKEDRSRLEDVQETASSLSRLSPILRRASAAKLTEEAKLLRKGARTLLRKMRDDFLITDTSDAEALQAWKYFEKSLMNIIEMSTGRNAYCRKHTEEYIQKVVAGKQPPFKKTIAVSDIISRREQILFSKLWRYIEARILPLAPEGIDSIVVERTAFDLLRGQRQKIAKASETRIEEIYQWGPMLGFGNSREMLTKEFGGLCAYCGEESRDLIEREHIMPRKDFFFDSYLNILPSCPKCNKEKNTRRIGTAAFTISERAYEAYCHYLNEIGKKRPLHALHTEKKGILNLMRNPERSWEADRYLSLIANSLASITQTQRGPRPLARYLYSRLRIRQRKEPEISFSNGRHTALYRNVAYPAFDKIEDKEQRSTVNHALDAILLASSLPKPTALEGRGLNAYHIGAWARSVRSRAPRQGPKGIPRLPRYDSCVDGFDDVDEDGYICVDMATMNWNQKDSATHKQDPYGWSEKAKKPTKRTGAQELYEKLADPRNAAKLKGIVQTIHHPGLRAVMERHLDAKVPGLAVAEAMKDWLRKSIANTVHKSTFSNHPADILRKRDLEHFASNAEAPIPAVIGIKRLDTGVDGKIDLERKEPISNNITHRYMTDPANKAVILTYPSTRWGSCNKSKPSVAFVRQNLALKTKESVFIPKPDLLQNGVIWNGRKISIRTWEGVLEKYLLDCGFHSYITLTPCSVVRYEDGTERFIRNFDKENFKKNLLKNVLAVRRNPFASSVTFLKELTPRKLDATE